MHPAPTTRPLAGSTKAHQLVPHAAQQRCTRSIAAAVCSRVSGSPM